MTAASADTWGFNAGMQLDIDASKTKTNERSTTAVASNLSGNNILIQTGTLNDDGNLDTDGTQTTIEGSHLNANSNLRIQTGDLSILASQDTTESQTETEHGHITAQMTVYGAAGGASISGSFDRSKASDNTKTHTNSTLNANNIDLMTSGDTLIRGGNVHADNHLHTDIAGNLTIESVQDRSRSRNTSMGISGGVSLSGTNVSGANAGMNSANGMSMTRETVLSSFTSGGTADINVGGHTQLIGALMATVDEDGNDTGNLNLTTDTLGFTDLSNMRNSSQQSLALSTSVSVNSTGSSAEQTVNDNATTTAQDNNGDRLRANTSNLSASNQQSNSASRTLATLGSGTITVGGTMLEQDGELTEAGQNSDSPLIGLNRDTQNTEKELWNSEHGTEVDATLDHRLTTKQGRQEIKNDVVDTGEFGQDIGRAIGTVRKDDKLGAGSFWRTLTNNTKLTQMKNELTRNPENAALLAGLDSDDPAVFNETLGKLGTMAQERFGLSEAELGDVFLYSGSDTTSASLGDTVFTDVKGGLVLDENNQEFGNIAIDGDNAVKSDLLNTLGHETNELITLRNGSNNDAKQEALSNAFGEQFSDRMNQAVGGDIDASSGQGFQTNLQASSVLAQGTQRANAVGNAQVDHRQLHSKEMLFLRDPKRVERYQQVQRENGVELTNKEAQIVLDRTAVAMLDEDWSQVHEVDEQTASFIRDEAAQSGSRFEDRNGNDRELFSLEGNEYSDPNVNLRDLYVSAQSDTQLEFRLNVTSREDLSHQPERYRVGQQQGQDAASAIGVDEQYIDMATSVLDIPSALWEAVTSDEVGPLDSKGMLEANINLLNDQGRYEEAGYLNDFAHHQAQSATLLSLPLAEIPVGAILDRMPTQIQTQPRVSSGTEINARQSEVDLTPGNVDNELSFDSIVDKRRTQVEHSIHDRVLGNEVEQRRLSHNEVIHDSNNARTLDNRHVDNDEYNRIIRFEEARQKKPEETGKRGAVFEFFRDVLKYTDGLGK